MSKEEKQPYFDMAVKDKERYDQEKKDWETKRQIDLQAKRGGITVERPENETIEPTPMYGGKSTASTAHRTVDHSSSGSSDSN